MVHGPVREVVRGPSPLDWSTDRGSVFSGHPFSHTEQTFQVFQFFVKFLL